MIERTLVLLKPDAVKRGITGEIIDRFEQTGLKIVGAKFMQADRDLAAKHYNKDDKWRKKIGGFRLEDAEKLGLDIVEVYGTKDPVEIGEIVNQANFDYLTSGPLFALVFEGYNAVYKVQKLVGGTPFSLEAAPGTIRGDYGLENAAVSLIKKRTVLNMIHASGTVEEAKEEIKLWFSEEELHTYKRVHEDIYDY